MGGATVMPYLKLHVPSVRGSALFWNNLEHSGSEDFFTRHAGCPVLIGSKMVMNKWIHSYGQEFRRPCKAVEFYEQIKSNLFRDLL